MTPLERRTFTAVTAALVGAPAPEAVCEAAAPFLARLRPADYLMLRLLLRMLEVGPLLSARPRLLSQLPRQEAEAHLRSWAESRLAPRRRGIAALRALAMLAYYGRDPAWKEVGYDGPWLGRRLVEVLPEPDLRTVVPAAPRTPRPRLAVGLDHGITQGRLVDRDLRIRADVCVIGTGAGGAAALARLAEGGFTAVAVEAGGYSTAADYTQRELEMLPLLYQEAGLRATADQAIGIMQGTGVGGSTLHNTGLVYAPPSAIVERWRREHGFALSPEELGRYVQEVRAVLRATPIPPDRINANNDTMRRGAEALGWRYRVADHNRESCSACGYCMLGCAYNRKYNATLTFLPRALVAGARILSDAAAVRIEGGPGARRVLCELRDAAGRPTGRTAIIEAATVVVAAGALDSPALLLRSGFSGPRLGRGLRLHPSASVSAVFAEPIVAWRGLPQSVIVEEFAGFERDGRGGWLFLPSAANQPALSALLTSGFGADHRASMRELVHRASASVLLHDETEGRVTVDRRGRPVARYWPEKADRVALRKGLRDLARLYLAAGAERVYLPHAGAPPVSGEADLRAAMAALTPDKYLLTLNSVHPQGTLALGAAPHSGAVDPRGQLWGHPGIYVADASLFPTSIGVPPQVTIMAVALAVADAIQERMT
jgi:choline dehydrogenase-like flavoprotein